MNKRFPLMAATVGFLFFSLAGCSNQIDTAKVRTALQSIGAEQKAQLDQALGDIDAGKYADALPLLRAVAFRAKLDSSQSKILESTMDKVRAKAGPGH